MVEIVLEAVEGVIAVATTSLCRVRRRWWVVLEADEMLTVMVLLELVVMTIFVKMMVTVKVEVVLVDVIGVEMIAMTMMKTTILTSNTTTVLQFINNIPSTTTKIVVYLLLQMHSDSSQLKIKCGTMSNR